MNTEFFEALARAGKEFLRNICWKIKMPSSLPSGGMEKMRDSVVEIDPETGRFYVAFRKMVVEEVNDPANEILLEQPETLISGRYWARW